MISLPTWRTGSSPRLRGTQPLHEASRLAERFIPAPAGNTHVRAHLLDVRTVHPRACGEHRLGHPLLAEILGSSPRLRGTHRLRRGDLPALRFIPAPAGNTSDWRSAAPWWSVHPRACGEHSGTAVLP